MTTDKLLPCQDCDESGKYAWGHNMGETIYKKCETCNGKGYTRAPIVNAPDQCIECDLIGKSACSEHGLVNTPCEAVGNEHCFKHDRQGKECRAPVGDVGDGLVELVSRRIHSQAYCNDKVDEQWRDFEDDAKEIISDLKRHGHLKDASGLVESLTSLTNGDYRTIKKMAKCDHGKYGYEDCENCVAEYAAAALKKYQEVGE